LAASLSVEGIEHNTTTEKCLLRIRRERPNRVGAGAGQGVEMTGKRKREESVGLSPRVLPQTEAQ
jgi:hypothetical protein